MKKNIIRIIFTTLALAAFASCEKPGPTPGPEPEPEKVLNENIKFTLEIKEVTATSAKVQVSHDGTTEDTWYAFATDSKNINEALSAKIVELTADGAIKGLKKQTNYTYNVNGLNPETDYTFIVFGITAEGITFGKPATTTFKTKRGEVVMEENPAWTVAYNGKATINDTEYEHTITVTSTDENKYFITSVDKATFESYDVKAIAESELAYLYEVVEYYKQQGYDISIQDMLFNGNGIEAMNLYPGDYYAIAIGIDEEGELSGLYAAVAFNIPEEEASEAYASWIGNWIFTGANGVAWPVTIHKGINNVVYYLSGWEGDETSAGIEIPMHWYPEDELWVIQTTNFGTFDFDQGVQGDIYLFGASMAEEGGINLIGYEIPLCVGGFTETGERAAIGYAGTVEDGTEVNVEFMIYLTVIDNTPYLISETEEWPTFPLTITPREAAATASVEKEAKSACKFTLAPKPIKTYYKTYVDSIVR